MPKKCFVGGSNCDLFSLPKAEYPCLLCRFVTQRFDESEKNQRFNGIRTHDLRDTGAMLYQLSYEATHWEQGQFIEFISSRAVKSCENIHEIIHICTAV